MSHGNYLHGGGGREGGQGEAGIETRCFGRLTRQCNSWDNLLISFRVSLVRSISKFSWAGPHNKGARAIGENNELIGDIKISDVSVCLNGLFIEPQSVNFIHYVHCICWEFYFNGLHYIGSNELHDYGEYFKHSVQVHSHFAMMLNSIFSFYLVLIYQLSDVESCEIHDVSSSPM